MTTALRVTRERSHEFRPNLLLRDLAMLVRRANNFPCQVHILQGGRRFNGKSFVAVSSLSLGGSSPILFETWGVDARECLAALCRIAARSVVEHEENRLLAVTLFLGPSSKAPS